MNTTHAHSQTHRRVDFATLGMALVVLGIAVFLTVGLLTMVVPATAKAPGPRVFPIMITVLAYVVGVLMFITAFFKRSEQDAATEPATESAVARAATEAAQGDETPELPEVVGEVEAPVSWRYVGLLTAVFLVCTFLLEPLGWLVVAAAMFFGVTIALGARPGVRVLAIAVIMAALIQLIFAGLLGLGLPTGFIGAL